jgi:hypothetical protein
MFHPLHPEGDQAWYHAQSWKAISERPFIWGPYVWNMFDFSADFRNEGDAPGMNDKGLVTYDRKTKRTPPSFTRLTETLIQWFISTTSVTSFTNPGRHR